MGTGWIEKENKQYTKITKSSANISVITWNINDVNTTIERQRLDEWVK